MKKLLEGVIKKYKTDTTFLQNSYAKLKEYAELESQIMPHVVSQLRQQMKQSDQKIKELKAILRTPRLYQQYRKKIELAVNDELARKYTLYGDGANLDSIYNT